MKNFFAICALVTLIGCDANDRLIKALGHFMAAEAVKLGAKRLKCLDGYLVKLYSDHGFVVTCAVEHNRSRPDQPLPLVVYMVHKDTPMGVQCAS